jgi:murein DD-endopeptidase MepM/ murein hydrolase activator NlpD
MRGWEKPRPTSAIGAASWGSLALAAVCGALATYQLGAQPARYTSAALLPVALQAERAVEGPVRVASESVISNVAYTPVPEPLPVVPVEVRVFSEGELKRGETLARSLAKQGVGPTLVNEIATALRPSFDFRYARAGDRYRLARDRAGRILEFDYVRSEFERYGLRRDGDSLVAERYEPELRVERARLAGVVTTSLYNAIAALGESGDLSHDFAEIFAWDVDFSRSVHTGDEFHILYERRYLRSDEGRERYVGPGRILAARYASARGEHSAVYYEQGKGRAGYYRPDGSAVERQFLQAPLTYRRITSTYSTGRLHPVLGRRRPHLGIDYAAATGTPVWAVGDGRVMFRGWSGGLGKTVKIRHENGFESWYGHLSRYPNLRLGQKVQQKQVIGYVGSTGLSTGPHLHFVLKKSGRHVNPSTLRQAAATPIPRDQMRQFAVARDQLLRALDPSALRVVTNEAL